MTLNYIDTYSCMFSLLDEYWEQKKTDDLGGLLSSMNPNVFLDGVPVDTQMVEDWNTISGESHSVTQIEGYLFMIQFIEKQASWLNLASIKSDLVKAYKDQDSYWLIWLKLFKEKMVNIS